MAKKFLDQTGVSHLWSKIKSLFISKGVGGIVTATSTDGVTYTATVNGVTALTTGLTITIIPSVVSTSISAKLNLNSLGAKYIRQSTTNNTATGLTPKNAGWMAANKPITIQYDGTQWKTIAARSNASDLNGTVAIANGGTGATTAEQARENLGIDDIISNISNFYAPDYTSGVSLAINTTHTMSSDGFIWFKINWPSDYGNDMTIVINGTTLPIQYIDNHATDTLFYPVKKGDTVKYTVSRSDYYAAIFYKAR